jgi:arginine decarboxylase
VAVTERIEVVWGHGEATTALSAFDAALEGAGIHNYNLVPFSSVVPAGAPVVEPGCVEQSYPTGAPVGAVIAENDGARPGETVAAGLGWATAPEGGVFMESVAGSADTCRADLEQKLADARDLRDWDWEAPSFRVAEHTVAERGAVVVAAVFGELAFADGPPLEGRADGPG